MDDSAPYVELRARSAFSFLRGTSLPETLIEQAAALGLPALGLIDRGGLYGAPRFYRAARAAGVRPLLGAEVPLDDGSSLSLLVEDPRGYRNLCRLLTRGKLRAPKGDGPGAVSLDEVEEHAAGLVCLEGHPDSGLGRALGRDDPEAAATRVDRLQAIFPGALHLEVSRHGIREEEWANGFVAELARRHRLPLAATGQVAQAHQVDRELADVLAAIRLGCTLDALGRRTPPHQGFHLRGPAEMTRLFSDLPAALRGTREIAARCSYTLGDLGYRFPELPLEPGETPDGRLRALALEGMGRRYGTPSAAATAQLEHELAIIARLALAGYFLVVWDLVRFCREAGILVQGRGSAANSVVCYALGITAVDPIRLRLLFERFLSEERGEWPDIDLDLPSGTQRERVIQYAFQRYGSRGAALTAVVITYRQKSASREVGKVLGFPAAVLDRLSRVFARGGPADPADLAADLATAGLDPDHAAVRHYLRLSDAILDLPRHIGQHPGGMVLCGGPLDEVVPLENAAMPGRVVIQWDKDDCEDLGLLKVDLLGLGMMAVLEACLPRVKEHEGIELDLARLPVDDPAVYDMLCAADTVGVFQVESRAQMATLPRLRPRTLYDLVVEVALIRPGPIQGRMVHPYIRRRQGLEPVRYPHPSLEPILDKTLGVPLFQEQLLRLAMVAAGFSGGEAEELRRAFSHKRSEDSMKKLEGRMRDGMTQRGITGAAQDEVLTSITSFAHYGFPESHAASFALLVYASAYLKRHHPAVFYATLLDEWPMGFYHPATVVHDAQLHGLEVRPIDVTRSGWLCSLEATATAVARPGVGGGEGRAAPLAWPGVRARLAVRLGLRYVSGLRRTAAEALVAARARAPFRDVHDLRARTPLDRRELAALARIGACDALGETRRSALWQVSRRDLALGPLFRSLPPAPDPSPLAEMGAYERTASDLGTTGITTGPHLMTHLRPGLAGRQVLTARELGLAKNGTRVRTAGLVICRQRPQTRTGVVFLSLEDETGISNAMVLADTFEKNRMLLLTAPCLLVEGRLQSSEGVCQVLAERFSALEARDAGPHPSPFPSASHDWR